MLPASAAGSSREPVSFARGSLRLSDVIDLLVPTEASERGCVDSTTAEPVMCGREGTGAASYEGRVGQAGTTSTLQAEWAEGKLRHSSTSRAGAAGQGTMWEGSSLHHHRDDDATTVGTDSSHGGLSVRNTKFSLLLSQQLKVADSGSGSTDSESISRASGKKGSGGVEMPRHQLELTHRQARKQGTGLVGQSPCLQVPVAERHRVRVYRRDRQQWPLQHEESAQVKEKEGLHGCSGLAGREEEENAGREEVTGELSLACIADASEHERSRTIAWLTDMAELAMPGGRDVDSIPALTDRILHPHPVPSPLPSSSEQDPEAKRVGPCAPASRMPAGRLLPATPVPSISRHDDAAATAAATLAAAAHRPFGASALHAMPSLPVHGSLLTSRAASVTASFQQTSAAVAPLLSPLSPPPSLSAPPCHLRFSQETLNSIGTAVRPLAMREVKALTLALVEAIMDRSMDAIHAFLRELEAASCPVGPAPQRVARYFATALASRVLGDALERYLAEVPSDQRTFEQAFVHYTDRIPFSHFISESCLAAVSLALSSEYEAAHSSRNQRPIERIHIIDASIESAFVWLVLLRQLADRPQGPPQSVRITLLDVLPPIMVNLSEGRRAKAMQLKEQLAVQAVVAGIEEFECDFVVCSTSRIAEGLAQVRIGDERGTRRRQQSPEASTSRGYHSFQQNKRPKKRMWGGGVDEGLGAHPQVPARTGGVGQRKDSVLKSRCIPMMDGRPVLDFLAVIGPLKMSELHDEHELASPTPRDTYLRWVRSLHPNVFLLLETVNNASGPFSVSRVSRVFDYNATFITSNDMCTSQSAHVATVNNTLSLCDTSCKTTALDSIMEANSEWQRMKGFRFGLPQLRLRTPEPDTAVFSQPLSRHHMLVVEPFFFQRTLLIVMAMEGERRYLRAQSYEAWVQLLKDYEFVPSPVVRAMTDHLCEVSRRYQRHIQVTPAVGGVTLDVCGRDAFCSSVWTTR